MEPSMAHCTCIWDMLVTAIRHLLTLYVVNKWTLNAKSGLSLWESKEKVMTIKCQIASGMRRQMELFWVFWFYFSVQQSFKLPRPLGLCKGSDMELMPFVYLPWTAYFSPSRSRRDDNISYEVGQLTNGKTDLIFFKNVRQPLNSVLILMMSPLSAYLRAFRRASLIVWYEYLKCDLSYPDFLPKQRCDLT